MIRTRALSKRYGRNPALTALNLADERGTVCGNVGPNGSGKTTTIRVLAGLLHPTSSTAEVHGSDHSRSPAVARKAGASGRAARARGGAAG